MNTYNHHLGDYAKDTRDLSPLEHGVYRLLLDFNYATEQAVPIEMDKLYRIVGAQSHAEKVAVRLVAERFFPVNGDGRRHNKRAEEEIARYLERVAHNRDVGKRGGRPRVKPGNNPDGLSAGLPPGSLRVSPEEPGNNPNHEPKPLKATASAEEKASSAEGRDAVATVPDCPHEKLLALYHELLPTCTQVIEWNDHRKALMRARWRQKAAGKPGYRTVEDGLAYWRRFFEYVAGSPFLTGKAEPGPGRKPFVADLEWLVRPTNFAKVVEGKYNQ